MRGQKDPLSQYKFEILRFRSTFSLTQPLLAPLIIFSFDWNKRDRDQDWQMSDSGDRRDPHSHLHPDSISATPHSQEKGRRNFESHCAILRYKSSTKIDPDCKVLDQDHLLVNFLACHFNFLEKTPCKNHFWQVQPVFMAKVQTAPPQQGAYLSYLR